MASYVIRRLLLLPLTLFCILLVNFVIINLAPGEPTQSAEIKSDGTRQAGKDGDVNRDDQYLIFREHYGLTLPILFNNWTSITPQEVWDRLYSLTTRKETPSAQGEMKAKEYNELRIRFGDQARYVMPYLLRVLEDADADMGMRHMAARFFVRGAIRQGAVGSDLSEAQKLNNRKIAHDNQMLRGLLFSPSDTAQQVDQKISSMKKWYEENKEVYRFEPSFAQKAKAFFLETRFFRYFERILTLDFGTLRNDANRTVISEVAKRFKMSLSLSIIPMAAAFVLCQCLGFSMAVYQNRWPDHTLNLFCLILYAVPVFVVGPWLIEAIALPLHLPFSGFHSPDAQYEGLTSWSRLGDIGSHLLLPLVAVLYGILAAQSRLSRTAILEVMRQDYVRTARAKGVPVFTILWKHIGRNASITIVTSLAASLGLILGGTLIVETIFGIDGFGRFFYEAILNRDYNVIMFSAIAGAFLALIGYLAADIAYTLLDPRVTLE